MISCRDVIASLSDFLDDDLSAAVRRELEAHLAECRTCEVIYDSMRKSVRLVTDTRSFELDESLSERLLATIRAKLGSDPDAPEPRET